MKEIPPIKELDTFKNGAHYAWTWMGKHGQKNLDKRTTKKKILQKLKVEALQVRKTKVFLSVD